MMKKIIFKYVKVSTIRPIKKMWDHLWFENLLKNWISALPAPDESDAIKTNF